MKINDNTFVSVDEFLKTEEANTADGILAYIKTSAEQNHEKWLDAQRAISAFETDCTSKQNRVTKRMADIAREAADISVTLKRLEADLCVAVSCGDDEKAAAIRLKTKQIAVDLQQLEREKTSLELTTVSGDADLYYNVLNCLDALERDGFRVYGVRKLLRDHAERQRELWEEALRLISRDPEKVGKTRLEKVAAHSPLDD